MKNSIVHKLLRRPPAMAAAGLILIATLVAAFAYELAPDHTPFANRMIVELGVKQPGFQKQLLLIPKKIAAEPRTKLSLWFSGTPSRWTAVPVNAYWFSGNELVVKHYIDEGLEDTLRYALSNLISPKATTLSIAQQKQLVVREQIRSLRFYLGSDRYGRDILSRLIVGTRVSISVGFVAVLLSLTIGIILGSLAGYFGGLTDNIIMWVINILWSIPTLLLVFAIILTVGKGYWEIFIAIGLTIWVSAARLIRGQVLVLREMEYITAARALGFSDLRIIFRHIMPNIAGPLMVIAAGNFATAILVEAGLSFLGIGVQPPQPSWGLMIKEHYNFLLTDRPLLAIIPGIAIMLLVYAFNVLGNALSDALDVKG